MNPTLTMPASFVDFSVPMSFAAKLVALRKEKGFTQQGLADACGIHVQQIKRYEAGTSQSTAEALKKLARTLHVSVDALLFDEHERGPDEDLRLQFEAITKMPKKERQVILELLDGMILKYEARRWASRTSS